MRVSEILRLIIVAGALFWSLALSMKVQAQADEAAVPPAQPLYAGCNLQGCEIWYSVPDEIDADAGEWQVAANGVPLDVAPRAPETQSVQGLNIMYVVDTSYPVRGQPMLDFRQALEDAPAQLARRGIEPTQLERMHASVAFLHLYQNDPVTFWCHEAPDGPCARNAPAWEYTNFRGVSNAVALMIANTATSNIKVLSGEEFTTEFVGPFARAMEAFGEIDGPKIVICFCEGLGPAATGGSGVQVEEINRLIEIARQQKIRVHVKHAWKAQDSDASQALARLAQQTGGVFVTEESDGIFPILDELARELKPYTVSVPLKMLRNVQGSVELAVAYRDPDGATRTIVSTSLVVPAVPTPSAPGTVEAARTPTPTVTLQGVGGVTPAPVTPTPTPSVRGACATDPLTCANSLRQPLLLAASTATLGLMITLGIFLIGRGRPKNEPKTITANESDGTVRLVAHASAEDITKRFKDVRKIAEFVLDRSPVETTKSLELYGDNGVWAIGRNRSRLERNHPQAVPLTISSEHVSREHALLRFDGRQFTIQAVLSADPENPVTVVRVNDCRATLDTPCVVRSGDLVSFSTAVYRFRVVDAVPVPESTSEQSAPNDIKYYGGAKRDPDDTWKQPGMRSNSEH